MVFHITDHLASADIDKPAGGFHQLNYLMFVARKKGEMGNIATLCFLQSGHFVLFNHYVSPRQQEYFRNDQK